MPAFHLRLTKDLNNIHTMETLHVWFYFLCQPVLIFFFFYCVYILMSQKCLANFYQLTISNAVHVLVFCCCAYRLNGVHILSFSLVACGTLVNSAKDVSADGRLEMCVCVRCLYSHLGTQWWPQTCCVWLQWACCTSFLEAAAVLLSVWQCT